MEWNRDLRNGPMPMRTWYIPAMAGITDHWENDGQFLNGAETMINMEKYNKISFLPHTKYKKQLKGFDVKK